MTTPRTRKERLLTALMIVAGIIAIPFILARMVGAAKERRR